MMHRNAPTSRFTFLLLVLSVLVNVTLLVLLVSTPQRWSRIPDTVLLSHHDSQPFQLATHESLGFFRNMPDEDWLLCKRRAQEESWFTPNAAKMPLQDSKEIQLWLLENVDPIFSCPHVRRIGGNGDGHKWVCDPHRLGQNEDHDCLVYSIGCNGDYSFEDDLVSAVGARRCEIHVFDMDPSYQRPGDVEKNNIHYHAWGLKAQGQQLDQANGNEYYSLQELMEKLGHLGRPLDILKVDCEGCEFGAVQDWLQVDLDVRQILMELHAPNQPQADFYSFFKAFRDHGFALFSKEANTHPLNNWASGQYIEFSFLRLHTDFFKQK